VRRSEHRWRTEMYGHYLKYRREVEGSGRRQEVRVSFHIDSGTMRLSRCNAVIRCSMHRLLWMIEGVFTFPEQLPPSSGQHFALGSQKTNGKVRSAGNSVNHSIPPRRHSRD